MTKYIRVLPENHQDREGERTHGAGEASSRVPSRTGWEQPGRRVACGPLGAQLTACCRHPAAGGLTTDSTRFMFVGSPSIKLPCGLGWEKPTPHTVGCVLLLRPQLFPRVEGGGTADVFFKGQTVNPRGSAGPRPPLWTQPPITCGSWARPGSRDPSLPNTSRWAGLDAPARAGQPLVQNISR